MSSVTSYRIVVDKVQTHENDNNVAENDKWVTTVKKIRKKERDLYDKDANKKYHCYCK